ncbi:hypothetical protein QFZ23_001948 [Arthrobacter globiformis]|uniref:hypothetical protein n=1 Tax=Arthrobacter globiformis TaxID=1665 RepID=UPI0027852858|nr:hypothetical protein [Arthrobacter globiformis]MDQ1058047.1 hypothetical protein [Arthrobacter globiformis]
MIELAHGIGAVLFAKGIENHEELAAVTRAGMAARTGLPARLALPAFSGLEHSGGKQDKKPGLLATGKFQGSCTHGQTPASSTMGQELRPE